GLSTSLPWLTPNHALNCGDVITAAASTAYSAPNFNDGQWGTVTCAAGNNVAWLKCVSFDACKITSTSGQSGMWIDKSYWGVQGWEVSTTTGASYAPCFYLTPNYSTPVQIHHLILANNVANGCQGSGINVANQSTTASIDYVSLVGNIVYNAAQSSSGCQSGITVYQPIQSDSLPGTHIYVAGNFSYGNLEPSTCGGHAPTDGEGIIFDTFDGSQGGLPSPYSAQAVADNNILVANGAKGLEVYNNTTGAAHAAIYLRNNTTWGNLTDPNQPSWTDCGELDINAASKVEAFGNIFVTNSATGCGANSIYAMSGISSDGTNHVYNNFAAGMSGHNTIITNS